MKKTKILIIQLRQFGDVLCCTPFIKTLKNNIKNSEIYFLTEKIGEFALKNNPNIKKIILFPKKNFQLFSLIKKLRNLKFDYCFDLMNIPKTAIFSWLINSKKRIGFKKSGRNIFYTNSLVKPDNLKEYMAITKSRLLKLLNIKLDNYELEYFIDENNISHIKKWVNNNFNKPTIAFCAVGRRKARLWLNKYWAELADRIIDELKMNIILIYGPDEKNIILNIASLMKNSPLIPPETNFNELGYILKNCKVTISNDTGPKHLSIAVKTPTLSINGPTIAECWTPPNSIHKFITADIHCLGCEKQECDHMSCMKQLTPDKVFEKLTTLI